MIACLGVTFEVNHVRTTRSQAEIAASEAFSALKVSLEKQDMEKESDHDRILVYLTAPIKEIGSSELAALYSSLGNSSIAAPVSPI